MNQENQMMAVCGIICSKCDMYEATYNPEIAKNIADWFKKERNEDVKPEDIHCTGCKGDRSTHWSADCWILQCCVDQKGLEYCNECDVFPCGKLVEWSKGCEGYGKALSRLKEMRKG